MTYDPNFCTHCDHFIWNDWWHDADCPTELGAGSESPCQPEGGD